MTRRTRWSWIALAVPLLLATTSCSKSEEPPKPTVAPAAPPSTEITREIRKGEGIALVFAITQQDIVADGSRILQLRGTHKGVEVGLIVVLGPKWESVTPDTKSKFVFHKGTVEYRTIGDASTALLAALDELYGTKLDPKPMRPETKFAGTSLQGDPDDLAKGEVRLKLVFESADPNRQAEVYTNIDLSKHQLRICEKDDSYRAALIRALQKD
jgi:hypothetical protein